MNWQTWFYPTVEFSLMTYCITKFRDRGGRSLGIALGALLASTLTWRIPQFYPDFFSDREQMYESLGYFNAFTYLIFAVYLIRGIKELYGSAGPSLFISGGASVTPSRSDVTRHLAASAALNGSLYRQRILDHFKKKYQAFAREPGVDVAFLVKICKHFERKEGPYQIGFLVLSLAYAFTLMIASDAFFLTTFFFFTLAWGISLYKELAAHKWLLNYFQRNNFDADKVSPQLEADVDHELTAAYSHNNQNLVVYNSFIPFVGNGQELGGWSFAVDLSEAKDHLINHASVTAFTFEELYKAIDEALSGLEFPGLSTQELLYVNGADLRDKEWILSSLYARPATNVPQERVREFIEKNDSSVRYYKCIQVTDWGHELIISYFLRLSRRGKDMFVEVTKFMLPPLAESYRRMDTLTDADWRKYLQQAIRCLFVTPINGFAAWLKLLRQVGKVIEEILDTENRVIRRQIRENPLYNYGAHTTLRQEFSSTQYDHYFQRLDKEMYVKTIEREILATIIKFLDAHNIDTSELKERQTTIINSGIIVQQGDVKAKSLAVGAGAQAIKTAKTLLGGGAGSGAKQ